MTILTISVAVGLMILSPADLTLMVRSAVYALFGFSNVFFWREYGNYFASNSEEAPLLHTWSLGVEEQFYFIWPLLLLILHRVTPRRIYSVILVFFILALLVSEVGTRIAASATYYLLPTRFFELIIGGFLALLARQIQPRSDRESKYFFLIGLILVIGSLFWTDESSQFPGVSALWPCIGVALLIWSGLRPSKLNKILELRPLVLIGLLSYSLYLWHWPIIVFVKYMGLDIGFFVGALIFAGSFLLAWLSWNFIEIPFRRSGAEMRFFPVYLKRFLFPVGIFLFLNFTVAWSNGFSGRFSPDVSNMEAAQKFKPNELRKGCHVPTALYDTPPSDDCQLGVIKSQPDGILLGDSFANHFSGMLDVIAKNDGLSIIDYTMDGCPPIYGYNNRMNITYANRCTLRNDAAYAHIEKRKYKHVILASSWPDSSEAESLLLVSIEKIITTGAQITIIMKNETIKDASTCSIRNAMYGRNTQCKQAPKGQPKYLEKLQEKYPELIFIDPNKVICNRDCSPILNKNLIYRDQSHLNDIGSRLIGEELVKLGASLLPPTQNPVQH